jgi:uncharacterized protein involved in exopolysaccharide biosynthesis
LDQYIGVTTTEAEGELSQRIERSLAALRHDYQVGQEQLRALELRQRELQNTLLRISGAMQALEDLQRPTAAAP